MEGTIRAAPAGVTIKLVATVRQRHTIKTVAAVVIIRQAGAGTGLKEVAVQEADIRAQAAMPATDSKPTTADRATRSRSHPRTRRSLAARLMLSQTLLVAV